MCLLGGFTEKGTPFRSVCKNKTKTKKPPTNNPPRTVSKQLFLGFQKRKASNHVLYNLPHTAKGRFLNNPDIAIKYHVDEVADYFISNKFNDKLALCPSCGQAFCRQWSHGGCEGEHTWEKTAHSHRVCSLVFHYPFLASLEGTQKDSAPSLLQTNNKLLQSSLQHLICQPLWHLHITNVAPTCDYCGTCMGPEIHISDETNVAPAWTTTTLTVTCQLCNCVTLGGTLSEERQHHRNLSLY